METNNVPDYPILEMFAKCNEVISQCKEEGLVNYSDDFEDVVDELLNRLPGFESMSEHKQDFYYEIMEDAWNDYEDWNVEQQDGDNIQSTEYSEDIIDVLEEDEDFDDYFYFQPLNEDEDENEGEYPC